MTARIAGILAGSTPAEIVHTVSSAAQNINAWTLFGSPTAAGAYHLIIDGAFVIGSDGVTSNSALNTGNTGGGAFQWNNAATLKITLRNGAKVLGKGGNGNSGAGGDAVRVGMPNVSFDLGSIGLIGGGGGGGTQGTQGSFSGLGSEGGGGGGGGGGQGSLGGTAGSGGAPTGGGAVAGTNGTAGSATAPGTGGTGGHGVSGGGSGADGGPGGSLGAAAPYSGGAPGKAVALNGFTVTWIAGNNSSQVQGAVS